MPAIPIALAFALAAQVPSVAPDTIVTFAKAESGLDPLAMHDNTTGRSHWPATHGEAVALASDLIIRQHHSVDLGLMQINDSNLARVSLSINDAFVPGRSMQAGAEILVDAYQGCGGTSARTPRERAVALSCAASTYNTGNSTAGIRNGYVAGIVHVAEQIVPSVRVLAENFSGAALATPNGRIEQRQPSTTTTVASAIPRQAISLQNQLSSFSR